MNVRYISNDTAKLKNGKVHSRNGDHTGCGARIDDNHQDWKSTSQRVDCDKNGCK